MWVLVYTILYSWGSSTAMHGGQIPYKWGGDCLAYASEFKKNFEEHAEHYTVQWECVYTPEVNLGDNP